MRKKNYMLLALIVIFGTGFGARLHAQEEPAGEMESEETVTEKAEAVHEKKYKVLEDEIRKLKEKLEALEGKMSEDELEKLREEADIEAEKEEDEVETAIFKSGARSLQALNPEISITGDFLGRVYINEDMKKPYGGPGSVGDPSNLSGFEMRVLGLSFQTNLDPYSFTKVVVGIHGGHFHLGEAYLQWNGIAPRLSIAVGKFRQLFGVINRWHLHALDQVDFPRPITEFFGPGGLNQVGASFSVLLPKLWAHGLELTVQVTNAMNGALFAGEFWSVPSMLGHLKNYYDLSPSTYIELGLSGMWGYNNKRSEPVEDEVTGEVTITDEPWRSTAVAGFDLTLVWEPLDMGKYRWFVWRTEAMYLHKETEEKDMNVFGGFSYIDLRVSQVVVFGARVDVGQQPLLEGPNEYVQAAPYITFWQSPWVKLRIQYNYLWLSGGREPEHIALFQVDWSAGPHKHEKY